MSSNSWRGEDKEVKFPTHIRRGKSGGEKKFLVRKFCEILVGFFFSVPPHKGEMIRQLGMNWSGGGV